MRNFLSLLTAICIVLLFIASSGYLPPLLSGLVLAAGLRPLLAKFPCNRIPSRRLRTLVVMVAFLTAFGTLSTYVIIASAKGIARHVEFDPSGDLQQKPEDKAAQDEALSINVDAHVSYEEKPAEVDPNAKPTITDKIKHIMEKIPGMSAEEITRTWSEILNRIRSMAFGFLSKFLTAGPIVVVHMVVFLISFIMFFWNYEITIATVRGFSRRFPVIEDCITFFENSTQATLVGTLVMGFAQGSIVSIGAAIAGFDSFILFGLCAFFASFVPFFGTALVWGSMLIYSLVSGDTQAAIIITVTGGISSVADNVILPTFVGTKNRVNPLLLFVVVLGMLDLIGIWGLFLGPVLSIFATRVVELWYERSRFPPPARS